MSHPVTVMQTTEKVGKIVDILKSESHNGFPVVEDYKPFSHKVNCSLFFFVVVLFSCGYLMQMHMNIRFSLHFLKVIAYLLSSTPSCCGNRFYSKRKVDP